jgi:hypothetical protein
MALHDADCTGTVESATVGLAIIGGAGAVATGQRGSWKTSQDDDGLDDPDG